MRKRGDVGGQLRGVSAIALACQICAELSSTAYICNFGLLVVAVAATAGSGCYHISFGVNSSPFEKPVQSRCSEVSKDQGG